MTAPIVSFKLSSPGNALKPSFYDIAITSDSILNPNYPTINGTLYDSWCIDANTPLLAADTYSAHLYSSYETNILQQAIPNLGTPNGFTDNLGAVNWLLNWYAGAGSATEVSVIQATLWKLMGDNWVQHNSLLGYPSASNITAVYNMAMQHTDFVPDAGQKLAVIVQPIDPNCEEMQPLILTTEAAKIGDYVWNDEDEDGLQDADEQGIEGTKVELVRDANFDGDFDDANEILATTVTDATGYYAFSALTPSFSYQVRFNMPDGFTSASPRQVDGDKHSGKNSDGLVSDVIVLTPGEYNKTIDAGFYGVEHHNCGAIGDYVWHDANGNGIQEPDEYGMSDVRVRLYDGNNTLLAQTRTDSNGLYWFNDLAAGSYKVQFVAPRNYKFPLKDAGSDDTVDSDAGLNGFTDIIVLADGEHNHTIDAGLYSRTTLVNLLGDRVWHDINANGIQDADEKGIADVTVHLMDATGTVVGTTKTDASGLYYFKEFLPGTYTVHFDTPAGYAVSPQNQGTDDAVDSDINNGGMTGSYVLQSGDVNLTVDAGLYKPASIGDFVWLDSNANGLQDANEQGLANFTVDLYDASGKWLAQQKTDAKGEYRFNNLMPAQYQVKFTAAQGYILTQADVGSDDTIDSDAGVGGKTGKYTLTSGEYNKTVDAGMLKLASLGDLVWHDRNANGVQDTNEEGIANVKVELLDKAGKVIQDTLTDAKGIYTFENLHAGTYQVRFADLSNYLRSPQNIGVNDALDSDADTAGTSPSVVLNWGDVNTTVDAGYYKLASIGDYVWTDSNANGVQDSNEQGLANVHVKLLDENQKVLLETDTDANGLYRFNNLKPGNYHVQFVSKDGYILTNANAGTDDAKDSDANTTTGVTGVYNLESGEYDASVDAGMLKLSSIGDFVWHDRNANGIQESGEEGIANIKVELLDAATSKVLATTKTDAKGEYLFNKLTAGAYKVRFDSQANYFRSPTDAGTDDNKDSDATADGTTSTINLGWGVDDKSVDAGLFAKASLGDFVWLDVNINGIQDAGETGMAEFPVDLYDESGKKVASTLTDSSGLYKFTDLMPGNYKVQFGAVDGFIFTKPNVGTDDKVDSDANSQGWTGMYNLESGEYDDTVDAGVIQLSSIGDTVWHDKNANGLQDTGEEGISKVKVELIDNASSLVIATTVTDKDGKYKFDHLHAGEYKVRFADINSYVRSDTDVGSDDKVDSDAAQSDGTSSKVKLNWGEHNTTVDAGYYKLASIGDYVWTDSNANGIQDSNEQGLANVHVKLLDENQKVLLETDTDANGLYRFNNLKPGNYHVQFVSKDGYILTNANAGTDDAKDSDANTTTGVTGVYNLESGEYDASVDAGMLKLSSIGDFVWHDRNANGIQESGEEGIANIKVELLDAATSKVLATTKTDAKGEYLFNKLTAGAYKVRFDSQANYFRSPTDAGTDDNKDSDATADGTTSTINLGWGVDDKSVDAGLFAKASLGDFVWLDVNINGIQDAGETGMAEFPVDLYDESGKKVASTLTDSSGLYKFTDLMPGNYKVQFGAVDGFIFTKPNVGTDDKVDSDANSQGWTGMYNLESGEYDDTVDAGVIQLSSIGDTVWHDKNANGLQDKGEEGISKVTVDLLDSASGLVIATTVTDKDGKYKFDDLRAGEYKVRFADVNGYVRSDTDVGSDDKIDSDAAQSDGTSSTIKLNWGEHNTTVDAGYYKLASLGDYVWHDLNANGIQETGENGLAGVKVHLFGANGVHMDTTTNAAGYYSFNGLKPGSYSVEFDKLPDYYITRQYATTDIKKDSDASQTTGKTGSYTLVSGESNTTVDCGMYKLATIGDYVWLDYKHNNVQDASEPGLAGAIIELYDAKGNMVSSTTTDANGKYQFTNLVPGSYSLTASYVFGYGFIPKDWGNDDTIDSDANYDGETPYTLLTSGEIDLTWDFGLTPLVLDLNKDGIQTISRANSTGTFDLFGNGSPIHSGWISSGDGFLAVDNNHNGQIDGISELFGGNQKGDGFAKLASFDSNQDGVVDANDAQFADLLVWQDLNGNHTTDAGELVSLAQAGISAMNVDYTEQPELDNNGNLHLERSFATLVDGSNIDLTDVYFNVSAVDAQAAGVELPSFAELLSSDTGLGQLLSDFTGTESGAAMLADTSLFDTSALLGMKRLVNLYDQSSGLI